LNSFLISSLHANTNQRECGLSREAAWSRPPSKLNVFGQALDKNKHVGKIMGGLNADPGNFPWQAALVKDYRIICGGTLVSPTVVISAPHCLSDYQKPEELAVSAGHIKSSIERFFESGYQYSTIKKIISHKDYERSMFLNDINLLIMKEPFEITDFVRPACLPQISEYQPFNGASCVVSGFGQEGTCNFYERFESTNLKNVIVEIVDNDKCARKLDFDLDKSQLCASGYENGMDACKGDSGGPLVCNVEGRWTLTGVVSYGLNFGDKNVPGVYTRVAEYLDWISDNSNIAPQTKKSLIDQIELPPSLPNATSVNCDVTDPCEGKEQCTTFVDGCGIQPVRGHHAGFVENPPKNWRASFDFKCSALEYTNYPKLESNEWLSVLELSTMEPGEKWIPGEGTTQVSFYQARDNPRAMRIHGSTTDFEDTLNCKDGKWDGFIVENLVSSDETSVVIIKKSNGRVFSQNVKKTQYLNQRPSPPKFNAYVSHELDWPASSLEIKNFIFERL